MRKVQIDAQASEVERNAARLLAAEVESRTGIDLPVTDQQTDEPAVSLQIDGGLGTNEEGFAIASSDNGLTISARQPAGLIFGVGRLLRESTFGRGVWEPPDTQIRDEPRFAVRNIYFAGHMGNWYEHASVTELQEYLDQMALWGYNELTTVLNVPAGQTFEDAWNRLTTLENHARGLGMRISRLAQSNTSYTPPPAEFRAEAGPIPGPWDVCPTRQPSAREFLVEDKRAVFERMQPFDSMILWPYDGGGCYCDQCAPWAKTFLHLSREIAVHAVGDKGEVRVSAWFFERDVPGEDDALFDYLSGNPDWFRHIVAGSVEARRWKRDGRVLPSPYRVLLFPEISMFDGIPWGGRGANPAPRKFAAEVDDLAELLDGGIVYSEGRYEDVNKILCGQKLWDPARDPGEIMRDYCRFYFGAQAEQKGADLLFDIEQCMDGLQDPERWRRGKFCPDLDEIAVELEGVLAGEVRESWRWKMLRAKTKLEALYYRSREDQLDGESDLRRTYENLQAELNLHDSRSLATWFYAPLEEAFPPS